VVEHLTSLTDAAYRSMPAASVLLAEWVSVCVV